MRKSLYSEEFHRVRNLLHHGGKRTSRFLSSFEMTVLLFVPDYAALRPGYMLTSPSPTSISIPSSTSMRSERSIGRIQPFIVISNAA